MRGITVTAISTRLSAISGAYFGVAVIAGALYRTEGGLMVILSGLVALLVFLAFLQRLLPHNDGVRSGWLAMTTSFGLIFVAMQASELAYFGVDFQGSATGASADLLSDVIEATFVASTIFFGLFVLSTATGSYAERVLPAWLTWPGMAVGAVTALAGALGVLSVDSFMPLPYVTGLAWTGVVSVLLAVRPSRAATGTESEGLSGRADAVGV
jgi:hypothetical protein